MLTKCELKDIRECVMYFLQKTEERKRSHYSTELEMHMLTKTATNARYLLERLGEEIARASESQGYESFTVSSRFDSPGYRILSDVQFSGQDDWPAPIPPKRAEEGPK
jgi:hypothetical protein